MTTLSNKVRLTQFCVAILAGAFWAGSAQAVPNFASQYDKKCSYCHNSWPQLNAKGRQFKELGYRMPGDEVSLGDYLQDLEAVPMSALLVARPYDKKERGDVKIRALHEVELIVAGALNKFSGWFEIEAEDETNFDPEIKNAVLTYNHSPAVNLQFAWGQTLWSDPYGFLGDHFRLTRGHVGVIDQSFGGADGGARLRDNRQQVSVNGRLADKVFYSVGWGGEGKDAEGVDGDTVHARIAFDATEDIMIGGFVIDGSSNGVGTDPDRDYSRWGIDTQVNFGDARIQGAYVMATDDNVTATAEEDNEVFSVQGLYTFRSDTGRPTWVPLIRYDSFEKSDGNDTAEALTFNVQYYLTENTRGYLEYFHQLDAFTGSQETDRLTLQLFLAF